MSEVFKESISLSAGGPSGGMPVTGDHSSPGPSHRTWAEESREAVSEKDSGIATQKTMGFCLASGAFSLRAFHMDSEWEK